MTLVVWHHLFLRQKRCIYKWKNVSFILNAWTKRQKQRNEHKMHLSFSIVSCLLSWFIWTDIVILMIVLRQKVFIAFCGDAWLLFCSKTKQIFFLQTKTVTLTCKTSYHTYISLFLVFKDFYLPFHCYSNIILSYTWAFPPGFISKNQTST